MSQGKSALSIVRKYHPKVTRVVDAKKSIKINVTKNDCKGGSKKSPSSCAMARACERDFDGAIISTSIAYLVKGTKATRYRVPSAVSREIVSFDRHHDFAPGEYYLGKPTGMVRLGGDARKGRKVKRKYVRTVTHNHRTAGIRSL